MQHFKMSTSRDFRINAASLQAAMEQAAAADDTDDNDGDEDNDEQVINHSVAECGTECVTHYSQFLCALSVLLLSGFVPAKMSCLITLYYYTG